MDYFYFLGLSAVHSRHNYLLPLSFYTGLPSCRCAELDQPISVLIVGYTFQFTGLPAFPAHSGLILI